METTTVLREDPRTTESTSDSAKATGGDDTEREIRAILETFARKGSALDIEGVMALYADDVATFDCPPPLMTHGKDPIRRSWQRDVVDMFEQPISYRMEDVHVHASDELAVARSLMRFHGTTKDGAEMNATLRCTHVFERREGQWLIVHDHVSAPIGYDGKGLMDLEP